MVKPGEESIDTEAKLAEFRAALAPDVSEMVNDNDCYRFLVARKYDVTKALDMINKWAEWYKAPFSELDCSDKTMCPKDCGLKATDDKEGLLRDTYFYSYTGEDKEGRPIYVEKLGLLAANYGTITKNLTEDEMFLRHLRVQELQMGRLKANSAKHGRHIGKQVVILDLKGLPIFPDSKGFRWIKRCVEVDEARYPEVLQNIFVINAPMYFTAIWAIVKPWIDEVTVEKIQIMGSNYLPTLSKYIDLDQLCVEHGGTREPFYWTWPENYQG